MRLPDEFRDGGKLDLSKDKPIGFFIDGGLVLFGNWRIDEHGHLVEDQSSGR